MQHPFDRALGLESTSSMEMSGLFQNRRKRTTHGLKRGLEDLSSEDYEKHVMVSAMGEPARLDKSSQKRWVNMQAAEATKSRDRFTEAIGGNIFVKGRGGSYRGDQNLEDHFNMMEAIRQQRVDMGDIGQAAGRPGYTYNHMNTRDPAQGLDGAIADVIRRAWDDAAILDPVVRRRQKTTQIQNTDAKVTAAGIQAGKTGTELSTGGVEEGLIRSKVGMRTTDYQNRLTARYPDDRFTQSMVERAQVSRVNANANHQIFSGNVGYGPQDATPVDTLEGDHDEKEGEEQQEQRPTRPVFHSSRERSFQASPARDETPAHPPSLRLRGGVRGSSSSSEAERPRKRNYHPKMIYPRHPIEDKFNLPLVGRGKEKHERRLKQIEALMAAEEPDEDVSSEETRGPGSSASPSRERYEARMAAESARMPNPIREAHENMPESERLARQRRAKAQKDREARQEALKQKRRAAQSSANAEMAKQAATDRRLAPVDQDDVAAAVAHDRIVDDIRDATGFGQNDHIHDKPEDEIDARAHDPLQEPNQSSEALDEEPVDMELEPLEPEEARIEAASAETPIPPSKNELGQKEHSESKPRTSTRPKKSSSIQVTESVSRGNWINTPTGRKILWKSDKMRSLTPEKSRSKSAPAERASGSRGHSYSSGSTIDYRDSAERESEEGKYPSLSLSITPPIPKSKEKSTSSSSSSETMPPPSDRPRRESDIATIDYLHNTPALAGISGGWTYVPKPRSIPNYGDVTDRNSMRRAVSKTLSKFDQNLLSIYKKAEKHLSYSMIDDLLGDQATSVSLGEITRQRAGYGFDPNLGPVDSDAQFNVPPPVAMQADPAALYEWARSAREVIQTTIDEQNKRIEKIKKAKENQERMRLIDEYEAESEELAYTLRAYINAMREFHGRSQEDPA